MKHRIRELATTIPGIFFILVACAFYFLDLLGKVDFTFGAMLPPLFLGLFLILFKIDDIKVVVRKVIGKITVLLLIVVTLSSCSLEKHMHDNRADACIICDDICEVSDSIYIEREVEVTKYDTIIRYMLHPEWLTASANVTDTVYIENEVSRAYSYVDSGRIKLELKNNEYLQDTITLFRQKVKQTTERFRFSQAVNNKLEDELTDTRKNLDKKAKQRNTLFIVVLILIILCTYLIRKKLKAFL